MKIIIDGPYGRRTVPAGVPLYKDKEPRALRPGEKITGNERSNEIKETHENLIALAKEQGIGLGDLIAAITASTGFRQWWYAKHKGECKDCNRRWAAYNYIRYKGWAWLQSWVIEQIATKTSGNRT